MTTNKAAGLTAGDTHMENDNSKKEESIQDRWNKLENRRIETEFEYNIEEPPMNNNTPNSEKQSNRISNKYSEVVKVATELICPVWVVYFAKSKVGSNRKNVYNWISVNVNLWKTLI